MGESDRLYLATTVTLFLGILGLGIALGSAIGLAQLQASCVDAGGLPGPGYFVEPGELDGNPCWEGAKQLQTVANSAGIFSAVLLLGGGVMDRYGSRIKEALA